MFKAVEPTYLNGLDDRQPLITYSWHCNMQFCWLTARIGLLYIGYFEKKNKGEKSLIICINIFLGRILNKILWLLCSFLSLHSSTKRFMKVTALIFLFSWTVLVRMCLWISKDQEMKMSWIYSKNYPQVMSDFTLMNYHDQDCFKRNHSTLLYNAALLFNFALYLI